MKADKDRWTCGGEVGSGRGYCLMASVLSAQEKVRLYHSLRIIGVYMLYCT